MGRTWEPYKAEAFTKITNLLFGPRRTMLRYVATRIQHNGYNDDDDGYLGKRNNGAGCDRFFG